MLLHDEEAERSILGGLILEPAECLNEVFSSLKNGPEAFVDYRRRIIYQAIVGLTEKGEPVDQSTITSKLWDSGEFKAVAEELQRCVTDHIGWRNVPHHVKRLNEKSFLRQLRLASEEIEKLVNNDELEPHQVQAESEKLVIQAGKCLDNHEARGIKQLVNGAIDKIDEYFQHKGTLVGLSSGIHDLDKRLGGLKPGNLCVIAGRPGGGKTALALNIAEFTVLKGIPTLFFSLEMTGEELVLRTLCSMTKTDSQDIEAGELTQGHFTRLTSAAGRLSNSPMHIDDTGGISIANLCARARKLHMKEPLGLVVVDYIQLVANSKVRKGGTRNDEVSEVSSGLKVLAKELRAPVIALSQLNREPEKENRRPRLSDLRESGSIEQDADMVLFLHRPEQEETGQYPVEAIIAKRRNGPVPVGVKLMFLAKYTRFEQMEKISGQDEF